MLTGRDIVCVSSIDWDAHWQIHHQLVSSLVDAGNWCSLDFLLPLRPGRGVDAAYRAIRARIPFMEADRVLATDIAVIEGLLRGGAVRAAAETGCGALQ